MKKIEHIVISSFAAACFCLTPEVRADENRVRGDENKIGTSATAPRTHLSTRDSKFVSEVTQGNLTEQRIGQLAQEKSQNSQVKEFGQKLVTDHAKSQQQLTQLAQNKGVTLDTAIDKHHEKRIEHLQSLSAAEFDKAVLHDMVRDHEKDVREFEREAQKADDPDVRNFASTTLATLQDHLQQARTLYSNVGGKVHEPAGAEPRGKKY